MQAGRDRGKTGYRSIACLARSSGGSTSDFTVSLDCDKRRLHRVVHKAQQQASLWLGCRRLLSAVGALRMYVDDDILTAKN